ncbi:MAG: hypothetical protein ACRYFS_18660 [Janthinobacterium lividum]
MSFELITKSTASDLVCSLAGSLGVLSLDLGEDICFGLDNWINVGDIRLFPTNSIETTSTFYSDAIYTQALAAKFGGYEWQLPTEEEIERSIDNGLKEALADEKKMVVKIFLQALQDAIRRSLLLYPIFDAHGLSGMPLTRPTTIVPDTSAVQQGALSFICQFLTPAARIKVPAIVHMEIMMQVDNYFSGVRFNPDHKNKKNYRAAALRSHVLSQGGQRTLLRLEIESDAELERGDLGADPLRGIVLPSSDPEDKALGLSKISRSFADRLIVETARQFRSQVRPDHPLALLTSDQGMARMAMAEGLDVIFFQARSAPVVCGRRLTGTLFHPFKRELYTIPLINVLWELAVSFGAIRLLNQETNAFLELWAIGGEELSWQTDHVREDLLWVTHTPISNVTIGQTGMSTEAQSISDDLNSLPNTETITNSDPEAIVAGDPPGIVGELLPVTVSYYKFTPNKMIKFIEALSKNQCSSKAEAKEVIGVQTTEETRRYINFLRSGEFIQQDGDHIFSNESTKTFWSVLITSDASGLLKMLLRIPSFQLLYKYVCEKKRIEFSEELPVTAFARNTYINMGEAALAWLSIPNDGIFVTGFEPSSEEFARIALEVYTQIAVKEQLEHVLTGQWLELLARKYAIHPVVAKTELAETRKKNLLQVYLEGSTPDTRFDRHTVFTLSSESGRPMFEPRFLYDGSFLLPGTSSVRIKIEGVSNAT